MIYLTTGVPGSGKTAYAMGEMLHIIKDRPLFAHGVKDFKLQHTQVICKEPLCQVCPQEPEKREGRLIAEEWMEWAPDGAVLFYDEVQFIYPPRRTTAEQELSTRGYFSTHRHRGLDFYFITQHPTFMSKDVRVLSSTHRHLDQNWARRRMTEWGSCNDAPKNLCDGIRKTYTLNKKVFELYKSAEIHTNVKRKKPFIFYALPVVILAVLLLGSRIYNRVLNPEPLVQVASNTLILPEAEAEARRASASRNSATAALPEQLFDFMPTIPNVPESAPAYSSVVVVKDFPKQLACMFNEKTNVCNCYTQQASLYKTDFKTCYENVTGRYFNPYIVKESPTEFSNVPPDSTGTVF